MAPPERILAIDTATEACSVALFVDGDLAARDHRVLGRGHAEQLVPMIADLPDKGRADRILVSLGPGSFTGVRIGIATARALGFAWSTKVQGYPTLALIAAIARSDAAGENAKSPVTVCMNGGHGEYFVQDFASDGLPQAPAVSISPDAAAARETHRLVAGDRARELVATKGGEGYHVLDLLPDAARALLLPDGCLTDDLTPIYGRGPDAKPQAAVAAS